MPNKGRVLRQLLTMTKRLILSKQATGMLMLMLEVTLTQGLMLLMLMLKKEKMAQLLMEMLILKKEKVMVLLMEMPTKKERAQKEEMIQLLMLTLALKLMQMQMLKEETMRQLRMGMLELTEKTGKMLQPPVMIPRSREKRE